MREALIFVVLALVIFGVVMANLQRDSDAARLEVALNWTLRLLGGLIAGAMAFALAVCGLLGVPVSRQCDLLLPLLGGLAVAAWHWAAAIGFALVGLGFIARDALRRSALTRDDGKADSV